MQNKIRTPLRLIVLCAVLLTSAILAMPAYADDGIPPVETPAAENPVQPPDQTSVTEEATPLPAPEVDPAPTEIPATESTDTILPDLPQGTEVVVLDEQGQTLPLASTEAADVLNSNDPMWCPAGVKPVKNMGGCSDEFPSFNGAGGLIAYLTANNQSTSGVIWILGSYQSNTAEGAATSVVLDGNNYGTTANFSLTIKGGWTGVGSTIDPNQPSQFIGDSFSIINWNNSVTLSDIVVTGTGAGANALQVLTNSGNIMLTNVKSTGNTGNGANLDNSTGSGTVSITNSQFNNNTNTGLRVKTKGVITLKDVIADNNTSNGATLQNDISTISGVTLTGTNIFSNNNSTGLYISSYGAITASNIFANSNAVYGAYLFNSNGITTPAVTLTGTNQFKYNGTGLYVSSRGQITFNNVTANFNNGTGMYLTNLTGPATSGVTFAGTNSISNNASHGLQINTLGTVLLNNMTVDNNGTGNVLGDGLVIYNHSSASLKNVTLTGTNSVSNNYGTGLYIISSGIVTLNNITASGNEHGTGLTVDNKASGVSVPKAVILLGTNIFNSNYGSGVVIDSYGAITTNNITANGNGIGQVVDNDFGADFDNSSSTLPQNITVNGKNSFSDNHSSGLKVLTKGVITTNNITASNSTVGNGVDLSNTGGTSSKVSLMGANIFSGNAQTNILIRSNGAITLSSVTSTSSGNYGADIENNLASAAQPVTLNGTNNFSGNTNTGLFILSRGAIIISSLTASSNTNGSGAELNNTDSAVHSVVSLTGFNFFNSNQLDGLKILSKGAVTTANLTANLNQNGYGVSIQTEANVNLTGKNIFDTNLNNNLNIFTTGAISLSNINSTGSSNGAGATIDNTSAGTATPKPITLTGTNVFSFNALNGLDINSYGVVTTSNITANNNLAIGVYIANYQATTPAAITLAGTNFAAHNSADGFYIYSLGLITTNNLTSNSNGAYGVVLKNSFSSGTAGVMMNGYLSLTDNFNGLNVQTKGAISGANLTVNQTHLGTAASLDNTLSSVYSPIKLSGTNTFNDNNGLGLWVISDGAVSINSITASNSATGGGVEIGNNSDPLKPQAVTFTGASIFNNNAASGLTIETYGTVIMNGITANGNGIVSGAGYGTYISNTGGSSPQNVTLNGSNNFNGNKTGGLNLTSLGLVTVNSITASNTVSGDGAYVFNASGTSNIKITGTNTFNNNVGMGLHATSHGSITLSNLTANSNTMLGVSLSNVGANPITAFITITGTNTFNDNTSSGLGIGSQTAVNLNNINAGGNGLYGLDVDNSWGNGNITLTGINSFVKNTGNGVNILSGGAVNLTKVTADDNGQSGLEIGATGKVTLTCGSLVSNAQYGINILHSPLTTLTGVIAVANTMGDINIGGGGAFVVVRNCPLP